MCYGSRLLLSGLIIRQNFRKGEVSKNFQLVRESDSFVQLVNQTERKVRKDLHISFVFHSLALPLHTESQSVLVTLMGIQTAFRGICQSPKPGSGCLKWRAISLPTRDWRLQR